MPKGTPDQLLQDLDLDIVERLVAVSFRPEINEKGRRMFKVVPTIIYEPVVNAGALPSQPPLHRDEFGHPIGSSHRRPDGIKNTVYTPAQGRALLGR